MDKWNKREVFLAHLVNDTAKSIHGSGSKVWTGVKCTHNGMNDTGGKVVKVQGLAESVESFKGAPLNKRINNGKNWINFTLFFL